MGYYSGWVSTSFKGIYKWFIFACSPLCMVCDLSFEKIILIYWSPNCLDAIPCLSVTFSVPQFQVKYLKWPKPKSKTLQLNLQWKGSDSQWLVVKWFVWDKFLCDLNELWHTWNHISLDMNCCMLNMSNLLERGTLSLLLRFI